MICAHQTFRWDSTAEPDFDVVAQYYSVPSLSGRNALFMPDVADTPGLRCADFCENWNHPNMHGHVLMADLVINFIMYAAQQGSYVAPSRAEPEPDLYTVSLRSTARLKTTHRR